MAELEKKIRQYLAEHDFMRMDVFMEMAVNHYYASRDPFGVQGDFTTSPEISQMFGEMLGVWVADVWRQSGSPEKFILLEAGPGRGTLMADMLRAAAGAKGFSEAVQIVLMENSPLLREKQKEKLANYEVKWVESLSDAVIQESDCPVIVIANEFLDALPIRQVIYTNDAWAERVINGDLEFDTISWQDPLPLPATNEGDVFEYSPARQKFVADVSDLIKIRQGAALFIDYGHEQAAFGETLQAVKNHQYVPILSNIGEADLTSHVDFGAFGFPVISQSRLLRAVGIEVRAAKLNDFISLERLTGADEMGLLFKAMLICHNPKIYPSGFDRWNS